MGPQRDDEDPYWRSGSTPKLRLAGQVDAVVDGRPLTFIAESQDLVISVGHWRSLLTIRHSAHQIIQPLREILTRFHVRLFVRIRLLGLVELHPDPSFLVRMLLPLD